MESHVSCSHRYTSSGLNVVPQIGVANGTLKNVSLRKFWQGLEISEAFLISLEVSFFHGLFLLFEQSRKFSTKGLGLGFLTRISASQRVPDFTIRHPSECIQDRPINAKRAAGFNNLLLFKLKLA